MKLYFINPKKRRYIRKLAHHGNKLHPNSFYNPKLNKSTLFSYLHFLFNLSFIFSYFGLNIPNEKRKKMKMNKNRISLSQSLLFCFLFQCSPDYCLIHFRMFNSKVLSCLFIVNLHKKSKQNNNIVFESEFYSPLPETVVCFSSSFQRNQMEYFVINSLSNLPIIKYL